MLNGLTIIILGFISGVAGNIIAGWIQQDVWKNVFTRSRIFATVVIASVTMFIMARLTLIIPRDSTSLNSPQLSPEKVVTLLPEPEGKLIFDENFEDGAANDISIGEGNWQVVTDSTGNKLFEANNSGSAEWPSVHLIPPFSDGTVEYQVKLVDYDFSNNTGSGMITFYFRSSLEASYIFDLQPYGRRADFSYVGEDGIWVPIVGGLTAYTFEKNVWYAVRVEMYGSKISSYLDGVLMSEVEDSRLKTGTLNFGVGPNTIAYFDNFKVWSLEKP